MSQHHLPNSFDKLVKKTKNLVKRVNNWARTTINKQTKNNKATPETGIKDPRLLGKLSGNKKQLHQATHELLFLIGQLSKEIGASVLPGTTVHVEEVGTLKTIPYGKKGSTNLLVLMENGVPYFFTGQAGKKVENAEAEQGGKLATLSHYLLLSNHLPEVLTAFEKQQERQISEVNEALLSIKDANARQNIELSRKNLELSSKFKALKEDGDKRIFEYMDKKGQRFTVGMLIEKARVVALPDNQNGDQEHRKIRLSLFIDGTEVTDVLTVDQYRENAEVQINNIDYGFDGQDRGVDTALLHTLFIGLKELQVTGVYVKLSNIYFSRKEQLYQFFIDQHGFVLENELTQHSWGKVYKPL